MPCQDVEEEESIEKNARSIKKDNNSLSRALQFYLPFCFQIPVGNLCT